MVRSRPALRCLILAPLNRLEEIIKSPSLMISDFICCRCAGQRCLSLSLARSPPRAEFAVSGRSTSTSVDSPEERLSQQLPSRL